MDAERKAGAGQRGADRVRVEPSVWSRKYEVSLRDGSNVEGEVATTILEAVRAALNSRAPAAGRQLRVELAAKK